VIYRSEPEKYTAIADEIERLNRWTSVELSDGSMFVGSVRREDDASVELQLPESKKVELIPRSKIRKIQQPGRPVLVGTVSIEKSERISRQLEKRGIKHEVLNAKHHKREAEIVAQAGRKGAVTIATNMAGRGTDIVLGGNPETMAWALLQDKYETRLDVPKEEWTKLIAEIEQREGMKVEGELVKELGGLHIIGTERHEARRIDLQLRGRCGRQGDPGSSRFYLSLEDDLMRIFAGEWVKNVLTRFGMQEGEAIESRMVTRRIEGAQKKVEERNFEVRKNLLEYDEVMDEQRKRVYSYRQQILDGVNCRDLITQMIGQQVDEHFKRYLDPNYGAESFAAAAGGRLHVQLEARDYRNASYEEAERQALDEARRMAESAVLDDIEENLPEEEEQSEWNWGALATRANTRWGLNLRDRDLKKIGRDELAEEIIKQASEALERVDLTEFARYLEPDFGMRTACAWLRDKFGVAITTDEVNDLEPAQFVALAHRKAIEAYDLRESEYPVLAGLYRYSARGTAGQKQGFQREDLVEWARRRFNVELNLEDLKNKQREEIRQVLVEHSRKHNEVANAVATEAHQRVEQLFADEPQRQATLGSVTGHNGRLDDFANWLKTTCDCELSSSELAKLDRDAAWRKVSQVVEDHFRPEMRRMERALLLQILDAAWKEHLLAMDHLRSSVGLRGYAQVDPKVEYKREGMSLFETMWVSVGNYVTDLIFKMEQLDEGFVGSTWVETQAIKEDAPAASEIERQQQAAIAGTEVDKKLEPIRNREEKVGRNEPCPCGSGKKYKNCCMRKSGAA
jgi:preprotein translocase subunit SecA